ncbi:MAG TPA: PfkB family carbohydrate kinase [Vicinamibacterales bacterium]|nr:PfkB family carbohydrate kinase [Vicinamibacterales bacterium]
MQHRWDVVGVGASAVDRVYVLPESLAGAARDAKLRIRRHLISCGGQVATTLVTCQRLGLTTAYIGTIGSDADAARLSDELARDHVDLTHVVARDAPHAFAVILIDERTGERMVLWDRDERLRLTPADVPPDVITRARLVHVDDVDIDASIAAATLARAANIPVTSDIERASDRADELIAAVTCPMFARQGLAELTGLDDPERGLRKMRSLNPGLLCVTLGPDGAMALDGDAIVHVPGVAVRAIDTTGAGDVFRGAFATAWLEGGSTRDVLRFANAAAALSSTRVGAISGAPTRAELEPWLTA